LIFKIHKPLRLYFLLLLFISLSLNSCTFTNDTTPNSKKSSSFPILSDQQIKKRFIAETKKLQAYLRTHPQYNQDVCIMVDMKQMSGKNRLFVVDVNSESIIESGVVAHGAGSNTNIEGELTFSNIENSHQTSLGTYAVGTSYIGNFGKAYKLHGLDASNSNAFMRFIVLHKYQCVPNNEQDSPICNSHGCIMVNKLFLQKLERIIDQSNQQILMEVYY
jgi:L,D-transpeptidase catalytic domain